MLESIRSGINRLNSSDLWKTKGTPAEKIFITGVAGNTAIVVGGAIEALLVANNIVQPSELVILDRLRGYSHMGFDILFVSGIYSMYYETQRGRHGIISDKFFPKFSNREYLQRIKDDCHDLALMLRLIGYSFIHKGKFPEDSLDSDGNIKGLLMRRERLN